MASVIAAARANGWRTGIITNGGFVPQSAKIAGRGALLRCARNRRRRAAPRVVRLTPRHRRLREGGVVTDQTVEPDPVRMRYPRAIAVFCLAYLTITIVAASCSIALEALLQPPPTPDKVHSASYVVSERFYPLLNLVVWTAFSALYFRRSTPSMREALGLGAAWLALALVVDYAAFVAIEHPFSLDARDFYIEQFPWIYLIYAAVAVSPALYVKLRARRRR
jgi:hypothetical protein